MNYTSCVTKPITKDDLDKVIEALKPKKAVVTSDKKVYAVLLEAKPFGYEVWFNEVVGGTFVIDLEEMKSFIKPMFEKMTYIPPPEVK